MIDPIPVIAITGATGFIGARLVDSLLAKGYRVKVLVRTSAACQRLESRGLDVVKGGLSNSQSLRRLCTGVAAVVHCAGAVRGRQFEDFLSTNVHGTRYLAEALAATSRAPILMLSSLAARSPDLSHYARSKQLAEEVLQQESNELDWTVIRPPAVYGPGDKELLPLFRLMSRGLAPVPASATNRVSLVHVDDLVAAIFAWIEFSGERQALKKIFPISDPREQGYSWLEIADLVSELVDRPVRLWQVPEPLLNTVAQINRILATLFDYAPMLTPEKVRELRHHDWVCQSRALSSALNWSPQITLRHGLGDLLACHSSSGSRNRLG